MVKPNYNRVHVFVSYSHKDERWLERLQTHLAPLTQDYDLDLWDDTRLRPGSKWQEEIRNAVDKANAAVLIISADFLASEFVRTNELPPLLKAAEVKFPGPTRQLQTFCDTTRKVCSWELSGRSAAGSVTSAFSHDRTLAAFVLSLDLRDASWINHGPSPPEHESVRQPQLAQP